MRREAPEIDPEFEGRGVMRIPAVFSDVLMIVGIVISVVTVAAVIFEAGTPTCFCFATVVAQFAVLPMAMLTVGFGLIIGVGSPEKSKARRVASSTLVFDAACLAWLWSAWL